MTLRVIDRAPGEEQRKYVEYPEIPEREQKEVEEAIVHFFATGRFREALMSVRNLDNKSRTFLEILTPVLESASGSEMFQERVQEHVNRSIGIQDGLLLFSQKRLDKKIGAAREIEWFTEMNSLLALCRHRNDLLRRYLVVSLGKTLTRTRSSSSHKQS